MKLNTDWHTKMLFIRYCDGAGVNRLMAAQYMALLVVKSEPKKMLVDTIPPKKRRKIRSASKSS